MYVIMGRFNIIHFIEHIDDNDDNLTDTQIIILHDEDDGNFYYYGSRNNEYQKSKIDYINYEGKFYYTRLTQFVDFISFLLDNFHNRITTEFHHIEISDKHYDKIGYSYLKSKLSIETELAAYNTQIESYDNIYTYLETLITHEI